MGCSSSPIRCDKTTPAPTSLASVCRIKSLEKSGANKMGWETSLDFSSSKAFSHFSSHAIFSFLSVGLERRLMAQLWHCNLGYNGHSTPPAREKTVPEFSWWVEGNLLWL
ncbi:hypothetical protein TNCT_358431 [Trichonephila clavata]|uniref:Uncharacterized protein n=1 Tax=Trichonephila clavata TaxID=2740835 RepID=A0A8X6FUN7_TRICU|nr:hypothetical protein TNCT_358431 [Trichonephila clavata]